MFILVTLILLILLGILCYFIAKIFIFYRNNDKKVTTINQNQIISKNKHVPKIDEEKKPKVIPKFIWDDDLK